MALYGNKLTVAFHKGCNEADIADGTAWEEEEVREDIDFHFPLVVGGHA